MRSALVYILHHDSLQQLAKLRLKVPVRDAQLGAVRVEVVVESL
jgi:hypothetical protein